jgi:hypothetical protein
MILAIPLQKKELSKVPYQKEDNMEHGKEFNHRGHRG